MQQVSRRTQMRSGAGAGESEKGMKNERQRKNRGVVESIWESILVVLLTDTHPLAPTHSNPPWR
jgi:hypothetical protein